MCVTLAYVTTITYQRPTLLYLQCSTTPTHSQPLTLPFPLDFRLHRRRESSPCTNAVVPRKWEWLHAGAIDDAADSWIQPCRLSSGVVSVDLRKAGQLDGQVSLGRRRRYLLLSPYLRLCYLITMRFCLSYSLDLDFDLLVL